jgi:hypothetical protein
MKFRSPFVFGKSAGKRSRPQPITLQTEGIEDQIAKAVSLYSGVQATLSDTIGAKVPPNNPYELASFMQTNGYHARCIRVKRAAVVGQGYDASPALRAKIDRPNGQYPFQTLLRRWEHDRRIFGNAYVNIVTDGNETALWHQEALKMRVKQQSDMSKWFVYYNYDVSTGYIGYAEYPEFEHNAIGEGVRQYKGLSEVGNYWYGDPDYLSIKPLLLVNSNIVQSAQLFYKRGLQTDTAVIVKGADLGPEEEDSIRQVFNQSFVGIKNARKVLLLQIGQNEEIDFQKLSADLQDEGTSNIRRDNRDEIVSAHGTPPRLVGIVSAGSLGGGGEVEAQLEIFKQLFADDEQREAEEWWQMLFEDLGFPDAESFKLKPLRSIIGTTEATDLSVLAERGVLTPQMAQQAGQEWLAEKGIKTAEALIQLRKLIDYGS